MSDSQNPTPAPNPKTVEPVRHFKFELAEPKELVNPNDPEKTYIPSTTFYEDIGHKWYPQVPLDYENAWVEITMFSMVNKDSTTMPINDKAPAPEQGPLITARFDIDITVLSARRDSKT
ncbi:MAG: hypothetical protein Q9219_004100 [cf. Caloplaca sp. 3 TL-2023]